MKTWALIAAALLAGLLLWLFADDASDDGPRAVSSAADTSVAQDPVAPTTPRAAVDRAEPTALRVEPAAPDAASAPVAADAPRLTTLFLHPDGTPAADLALELAISQRSHRPWVIESRSDADGRVGVPGLGWPETFTWTCAEPTLLLLDLADADPVALVAEHGLTALADAARNRLRCGAYRLRSREEQRLLVLPSTTSLSGTVLGPDGTPRAGLSLALSKPTSSGNRAEVRSEHATFVRAGIPDPRWEHFDRASTDADGRFHFPHVPSGELRLHGSFAVSDDELQVVTAALTARPDVAHELGVLPLGRDRAPAALWLDLMLDGEPVDVNRVWESDERFELVAILHDVGDWPTMGLDLPLPADTRARVFGLPDATWRLAYSGQLDPGGFVPPYRPVLFGFGGPLVTRPHDELRVPIAFFTWIPVLLEVHDAIGLPDGTDLELSIFGEDLGLQYGPTWTRTPVDPTRPAFPTPAGRYVVIARESGEQQVAFGVARVEVSAPGPARATLRLSRAGAIEGRLVDEGGAGVGRHMLQLWPVGSPTDAGTRALLGETWPDENGAFRFTNVPADTRVELRISSKAYEYARLGPAFETPAHGSRLRLPDRVVPAALR